MKKVTHNNPIPPPPSPPTPLEEWVHKIDGEVKDLTYEVHRLQEILDNLPYLKEFEEYWNEKKKGSGSI